MANSNIALLTLANTFADQMNVVNNLANAINEIINGNLYADGAAAWILPDGTLQILTSSGTVLSVSGNVNFSQYLTVATLRNTANANIAGFLNVATQIVTPLANINTLNVDPMTAGSANVINTLNVAGQIVTPHITATTANATTLNVSSLVMGNGNVADLYSITLDPLSEFGITNGNATFNNVTVRGSQTIEGTTVLTTNAFQIRTNSAVDGEGAFEVWRGTSINANAALFWDNSDAVWQTTANDQASFATILTTGNLIDTFTSTSNTNAATANAVNAVFAAAISNAAGIVANNGAYVTRRQGIDFLSGLNITIGVSANASNTNLTDVSVQTNSALNVVSLNVSSNIANVGNLFITMNTTTGNLVVSNTANIANANLTQIFSANIVANSVLANTPLVGYSNTGTITGNTNVNCVLGSFFDWTLANNSNVWFNNAAPAGTVQMIQILLRQSANGGNTITWENNIYWSDNTIPILSTTSNTGDILQFISINGGTCWMGSMVAANMKGMNTVGSYI